MEYKIKPININGAKFWTVNQFAFLTNRSDQSVYSLISKGNTIRKLKSFKFANRVLIPYKELTDFPFTPIGAGAKEKPYHYNEQGETVYAN
tara:strand:+ start:489 stop:761 length:273 start_codon:yes stop_codon:yes gene_type:complete